MNYEVHRAAPAAASSRISVKIHQIKSPCESENVLPEHRLPRGFLRTSITRKPNMNLICQNTMTGIKNISTFYFDTGVRPENRLHLPDKAVWRGTMQFPFECENVPQNATLMFLCDNPKSFESEADNVIVRKLLPGSGMISKYAYFRLSLQL